MRVDASSAARPIVSRRMHALLSAAPMVAFLLSGASGLVFQTIWSRLLHHVFGSSSVAISSVVSAFMGGLSLGAYLFGRIARLGLRGALPGISEVLLSPIHFRATIDQHPHDLRVLRGREGDK